MRFLLPRLAVACLISVAMTAGARGDDLTTANGYNWLIHAGDWNEEPSYILPGTDPPGFIPATVPGQWGNHIVPEDMNYGWYRLHFHVPEHLKVPGRGLIFRVRQVNSTAIGDVDRAYFNGVAIGQTGEFPHVQVAPGNADAGGLANYYPGLATAESMERVYRIPANLVQWEDDNVMAVIVFNRGGSGGLIGIPSIELSPPHASVSGNVYANGTGIFGVRVAAMGPDGITSDWTITNDRGRFVLPSVDADDTIISVAKPGYEPVAIPIDPLVSGQFMSGVNIQITVAQNGWAPLYDEFEGTSPWTERFEAVSLLDPGNNASDPIVDQPGHDVSSPGSSIPGSVTVASDSHERAGILTKQRMSRFASISSARLVSALSSEKSGAVYMDLPNVVFHLNGNPNPIISDIRFENGYWLEFRLENYVLLREAEGSTRVEVRWKVHHSLAGIIAQGAVPLALSELKNVHPDAAVTLTVARLGSFYDFFINNDRVFFANLPTPAMADHRIFLYNADLAGKTTWDWLRAGPTMLPVPIRGDLDHNGRVDGADASLAVRISGGLAPPGAAQMARGDVTGGDTRITILDALRLVQTVNGLTH